MSPISGIVLIMKNMHAVSAKDMDYKGIGVGRNQQSMINDKLSMINYWSIASWFQTGILL